MARADGRLIIGSRVHMAWPDPLARLVENGQAVIDVGGTHANQPTFRLAKETYHRIEIELIVDALSGKSAPMPTTRRGAGFHDSEMAGEGD